MSLIAWYKLDGNAKNNTGDASLNGTPSNLTYTTGKFGEAGNFNSSSINLGRDSKLNLVSGGSISVGIKPDVAFPSSTTSTAFRSIIGKVTGGGTGQQSYFIDGYGTNSTNILRFGLGDSVGSTSLTYNFNPNQQGAHIVATGDGTTMKLFVNGSLVNSTAQGRTMQILNTDLVIGSFFTSGSGLIDDVRIYNRALSDSEIKRLAGIQNRALIAHWPLNGNGEDITGNGYNLSQSASNITGPQGLFSNSVLTDALEVREKLWFPTSTYGHFDQGPMTISVGAKRLSESFHYILCRYVGRITFDSLGRVQFTVGRLDPGDGTKIQVNGDTISATSTTNLTTLNKWHHIVAQYYPGYPNNNGYIKLYLDGTLVAQSSLGNKQLGINYAQTQGLKFGSTSHGSWTPVATQIDETRIYNYILTEDEIKKLAQPLVLHYKFDDSREEATQNYAINPQNISLLSGMSSDGSLEKIDNFTIKITALKNNPSFSTYGDITNNGGNTVPVTANTACTLSCEVVDFKGSLSRLYPASGGFGTIVGFGTKFGRVFRTITHTSNGTHDIRIRTTNQSAILSGDYLTVRFPQIEIKPYPTPFTTGIRSGAIIKDSSLSNGNGTVALSTSPKGISGEVSYGAMEFDGAQVIESTTLAPTHINFTSTAGIYLETTPTDNNIGRVICQHYSSGGGIWSVLPNLKLQFRNHNNSPFGTAYNLVSASAIALNNGFFVSIVDDGTNAKIYINGILNSSMPRTTTGPSVAYFKVGAFNNPPANGQGIGKIDDVRVYNKALSDSEILQIYNERSGQMRFNDSATSAINMTSGTGKIEIK